MKLLERLKQWHRTWPQGPTTYKEQLEPHHCLNCGLDYEGCYCPRCGQKSSVGRITWNKMAENFLDVWDFTQRSAFSTLLQLLYRPGYVVHDFLQGQRARYFHPVKLLLVVGILTALFEYWQPDDEEEGLGTEQQTELSQATPPATDGAGLDSIATDAGEAPARFTSDSAHTAVPACGDSVVLQTQADSLQAQRSERKEKFSSIVEVAVDWANENDEWSMLILCSFFILPTRKLFRHAPRNGKHTVPEGFFIQAYFCSPIAILSSVIDFNVFAFLGILFYYVAYRQLFGYGRWATLWRVVLILSLSTCTFFALLLLSFIIAAVVYVV